MNEQDGVIQFQTDHRYAPLEPRRFAEVAHRVTGHRALLHRLGLVGQDPTRYGGAGFGNVSERVGPFPGPPGGRGFLITGSQTGHRASIGLAGLAWVKRYETAQNRVESEGELLPSSESLTHGMLYDLSPAVRFVIHAHCPELWRATKALKLPTTAPTAGYGTQAMAEEVRRLAQTTPLLSRQLFVMGGHEDGVVSFGANASDAFSALTAALADVLPG